MSAVVIAGNTSGTVTLQAPAVAGTTTLNLPATNGTLVTSNASNQVLIGTTTAINSDALQVAATTGPLSSVSQFRYTADSFSPQLRFYKSRATSIGSFTAVQNLDSLGVIQTFGSDGTAWTQAGYTSFIVDGTVSTGVIPSSFAVVTTNSSGVANLQAQVRANGDLLFNSGYGSCATAYGCRAWVSFNGTTGATRGSGNVTSVTRTGTGAYTIALTTAMPDTNYAITAIGSTDTIGTGRFLGAYPNSTSSILVASNQSTGAALDLTIGSIAIFR